MKMTCLAFFGYPAAEQEPMNVETIYKILISFDKIYDKMNDRDKRDLKKSMIKEIKLYMPEE